ncbi:hypothetical protein [Endozoicomonas sp. 2B-B]
MSNLTPREQMLAQFSAGKFPPESEWHKMINGMFDTADHAAVVGEKRAEVEQFANQVDLAQQDVTDKQIQTTADAQQTSEDRTATGQDRQVAEEKASLATSEANRSKQEADRSAEQVSLTQQEGSTQIAAVKAEGTTQKDAVTSQGNQQVNRVTTEGNDQINRVVQTGNQQVSRVETAGDEKIAEATSQANTATSAANAAQESKNGTAQDKTDTANSLSLAQTAQQETEAARDTTLEHLNESKQVNTTTGTLKDDVQQLIQDAGAIRTEVEQKETNVADLAAQAKASADRANEVVTGPYTFLATSQVVQAAALVSMQSAFIEQHAFK